MKLIIDWYEDETRKFLEREVVEAEHNPWQFLHAWMTRGAIWKDYALRSLTKEEFEEALKKRPI